MALLDRLGHANLGLMLDAYHAGLEGLDPLAEAEAFFARLRHVQIARVPDRHEPDPQTAAALLDGLDRLGYAGWIGAEYNPAGPTEAGLGWSRGPPRPTRAGPGMTDVPLAIEARGLTKRFGELTAVGGVDLDVPRGMIFAILGPNGAGKTTLLRMLATLLRPDGGTAAVMGHDLVAAPEAVRGAIAMTGQFASSTRI